MNPQKQNIMMEQIKNHKKKNISKSGSKVELKVASGRTKASISWKSTSAQSVQTPLIAEELQVPTFQMQHLGEQNQPRFSLFSTWRTTTKQLN